MNDIILYQGLADRLEYLRKEGRFNMLEFNSVQRRAFELEFYDVVTWMEDHKSDWGKLIMGGFLVDTGDGEPIPHREYFDKNPVDIYQSEDEWDDE